jgi:hypothetical protein
MPVLAVGGAASTTGPLMEDMMREVAANVRAVRIAGTAHWIAEENPQLFAADCSDFSEPPGTEYPALAGLCDATTDMTVPNADTT